MFIVISFFFFFNALAFASLSDCINTTFIPKTLNRRVQMP